jgi:hypothetical protein
VKQEAYCKHSVVCHQFDSQTVHLRAHGGTSNAVVEGPECASELVACEDAGELPPYIERDALQPYNDGWDLHEQLLIFRCG